MATKSVAFSSLLADYKKYAPACAGEVIDIVESGDGCWVKSITGSLYLDFSSGGFGYTVPEIASPLRAQMKKVALSSRLLICRYVGEVVYRLQDMAPGRLDTSYLCNSSGEGFEGAIKLAKGLYPARRKVVVIEPCTGCTLTYGCLAKGAGAGLLESLNIDVERVNSNVDNISNAIDGDTLCVIFDPIFTGEYLAVMSDRIQDTIHERAKEVGALCVANESATGFAITGKTFTSEHLNFVPDVIVFGTQLDGGCVPFGGYITTSELNERVYGLKNPTLHGSTTAANPLGCMAACLVLDYIKTHNLVNRHVHLQALIESKLVDITETLSVPLSWSCIGSVLSIDLSEALHPSRVNAVFEACSQDGLMLECFNRTVLQLKGALIVGEGEWIAALDVIESSLRKATSEQAQREAEVV